MVAKLLAIVSAFCFVSTAYGIKCYSCDSSKDVACSFGLLSFTQSVSDCSTGDSTASGIFNSILPHNCIKLVAKDKDGNEYVARGCGVNTGINLCQVAATALSFMPTQGSPQDLQCYQCDTDKCNSATSVGGMAILSILAACILYLL